MRRSLIATVWHWAALTVLGLALAPADADTITVCWDGSGDYPTIQEGIDAASHWDEVVVCDGTYTGEGNKNLDFGGKFIAVRSQNGPDNCIIDCQGSGRGFYFHNFEPDSSVVDGFTITDGQASLGGAVHCNASSPTIMNCTITGSTADRGGGLDFRNFSSPTITNCDIRWNTAAKGGGVCCSYDSSARIIDCRINDNTASQQGGGIWCYDNSSLMISWSSIEGNTAGSSFGGGVFCAHADAMLTNCTISENSAGDDGGGMWLDNADVTLTNCAIARNTSGGMGGAMRLYEHCNVTIANCTIAGNTAAGWGGAIHAHYQSDITICNSILWGNSQCVIRLWSDCELNISYSDLQGGSGSVCGGPVNWGPGNIDANPLFADAGNDDYRLWAGSPCIDAGDNTCVPPDTADVDGDGDTDERTPLDLDRNPRFIQDPKTPDTGLGECAIVDMGAYEFQTAPTDSCPADLCADGVVDPMDLAILLGSWGPCPEPCTPGDPADTCPPDFDGDCLVGPWDLAIVLGNWGPCEWP